MNNPGGDMSAPAAEAKPKRESGIQWPEYWTVQRKPAAIELRYAVRGGGLHAALTAFGGVLALGSLYSMGWLVAGWFGPGGEVLAGSVIAILFLVGVGTAGVYILDRMLYAAMRYRLEAERLTWEHTSLFGRRSGSIPKAAVREIFQHYLPPGSSESLKSPGSWTTFVRYEEGGKKLSELPLEGLHSPEEARWFGPLFSQWAGVEIKRDYAASFEEADPALLPKL